METMNTNENKKEQYDFKRAEKEASALRKQKTASMKRAGIWTLGILAVVGGLAFLVVSGSSSSGGTALLIDALSPTDWVEGNTIANATLIEYSDFQCPACGAYYPLVKQLTTDLKDKFQFAYRHFPLSQHQNAKPAAYAAEAAGKQGKFWEMHAAIFENQSTWSDMDDASKWFRDAATGLKLNMEQYDRDVASKEVRDKVENDFQSGLRASVNSTPTFFLNGKQVRPQSYDEFKTLITQASGDNS